MQVTCSTERLATQATAGGSYWASWVRGAGIGTALLEFAELWATKNALQAVFLDSRQEVVTFYSALGYEPHTATLMKKRISTKPSS